MSSFFLQHWSHLQNRFTLIGLFIFFKSALITASYSQLEAVVQNQSAGHLAAQQGHLSGGNEGGVSAAFHFPTKFHLVRGIEPTVENEDSFGTF